MHTDTIVVTSKNKTIPDPFHNILLDKHKTAVGFAAISKTKMLDHLSFFGQQIDLAGARDVIVGDYNESNVIYSFQNYPDGMHEQDTQPFEIMKNHEGKTLLVAFLAGDFAGFVKEDSTHASTFYVVTDYLADECKGLFQENGEDVDKFCVALESPKFRNRLQTLFVPSGSIVMMDIKGNVHTYKKGIPDLQTSWGWTSNKFDYTEAAEAPAVTSSDRMAALKEKLARERAKSGSPAASTPAADPKTSVPTIVPDKTDTRIPDKVTEPIIFPPNDIVGNKNKVNSWFERNLHRDVKRPLGWESGKVGIPYSDLSKASGYLKLTLKSFQDLEGKVTGLSEPPLQEAGDKGKDGNGAGTGKEGISETPPLVPPGQVKSLTETFFKEGYPMMDVEQIKATQGKYPPASAQVQKSLSYMLQLDFKQYRQLTQQYSWFSACLLHEFRNELIKLKPELIQVSEDEKELQEALKQQEEATKKMEALKAKLAASRSSGKAA